MNQFQLTIFIIIIKQEHLLNVVSLIILRSVYTSLC